MENTIRRLLERAIVSALIQECDRAGFMPHFVDDGGENVKCSTEHTALEAIFAVDEARLFFRAKDDAERKPALYGVFLVGGNGADIISDWNCGNASFDAAVSRVASNVEDLVQISLAQFVPCPVASVSGVACTRPAGHKHDRRPHVNETHEGKDYSRW